MDKGTEAAAPLSSPMAIPRPEDAPPPPAGIQELPWPAGIELSALDTEAPDPQLSLELGLENQRNTAPGAPVAASPSGTADSSGDSSAGSPHSSRRRGRPRKGEERAAEDAAPDVLHVE